MTEAEEAAEWERLAEIFRRARAERRRLETAGERVTVDDLARIGEQFSDLADEGVMRSAWDTGC